MPSISDFSSGLTLAAGGSAQVGVALAAILVLGIGAQWVAWRFRVPSILLLLATGFVTGPVARLVFGPETPWAIHPDAIFQDLLLPLVGLSVGLILYEGGLTLTLREIAGARRVVTLLVTVGALVTWVVAGLAARFILGLPPALAVLLGAILIVTGPTVIGPMLGHIRPAGSTGPILKWEGIVIDPIGVLMAVLAFEAILILMPATGAAPDVLGAAARRIGEAVATTVVVGGGLGVAGAGLLIVLLRRFLIPDFLQNAFSLMLVVATFAVSNFVQAESGLLATVVMGVVLANQKQADVLHILEFKENLRVLLLSVLFIVLAARLELASLRALNPWAVSAFLAVLILVARPLGVFLSTIGSGLSWREKVFLAWMAPRGIVAAAGSSIFALALENAGVEGAGLITPYTFAVIVGTVTFYGLTAPWVGRRLGISDQNPQGLLILGASRWARQMARALVSRGVRVLLLDTNRANVRAARMDGLEAHYGNILDGGVIEELDLRGIGRALALTPNDEVNALAIQRLERYFDSAQLYVLPSRVIVRPARVSPNKAVGAMEKPLASPPARQRTEKRATSHHGRHLFSEDANYTLFEEKFESGWVVKATTLTPEFTFADYQRLYGPGTIILFVVTANKNVHMIASGRKPSPNPGDTIISLVNPDELLMPSFAAALENEDAAQEEEEGEPGSGAERHEGERPDAARDELPRAPDEAPSRSSRLA